MPLNLFFSPINALTIEPKAKLVATERAVDNTDPTIKKTFFFVMTRDEGALNLYLVCVFIIVSSPINAHAIDHLGYREERLLLDLVHRSA